MLREICARQLMLLLLLLLLASCSTTNFGLSPPWQSAVYRIFSYKYEFDSVNFNEPLYSKGHEVAQTYPNLQI